MRDLWSFFLAVAEVGTLTGFWLGILGTMIVEHKRKAKVVSIRKGKNWRKAA